MFCQPRSCDSCLKIHFVFNYLPMFLNGETPYRSVFLTPKGECQGLEMLLCPTDINQPEWDGS